MIEVQPSCHGNNDDHCCYLGGEVCPFLEENTVKGRRWACGLFRKAKSWDKVYRTRGYRTKVKPKLIALQIVDCGDWPQKADMPSHASRCCMEVTNGDAT